VQEVIDGNADLAVAFQPEVARYVRASTEPFCDRHPERYGWFGRQTIRQHFDTAMGVRKGDEALLEELNAAIRKAQPEIKAILDEEAVITLKAGS